MKRMADSMGLKNHSIEAFIEEVEGLLDDIGIPKSLSEIDVPSDCAQRIAGKAKFDSAAATNPRIADLDEIRALIDAAIVKAR